MRREVVITGIGPITAFGVGIDPLWSALMEGRSAVSRIDRFAGPGFTCSVAAEMPEDAFNIRKVVPRSYRKNTKVMCRDVELAVGAAAAAVVDAGLVTKGVDADATPTIPPERFGCHIGAGLISADVDELSGALVTSANGSGTFDLGAWGAGAMENLTPLWLLKYLPNMLACHVTIVHDCQGPSNTITCCEASSALSLGESMRVIQRDAADACLTGGAEGKLNLMAFLRQQFTGRLAPVADGDDPAGIVRPFAPDARGTVLGEGGGILVLEAAETAAARGATPYARVASFATTQSYCPDTVGLEIPPEDESLADAVRLALDQAGIGPDDLDAVVPFGSSIPIVDAAEATTLRAVLGDRAASVPIVTTVPAVGNCAAGNGAVALCVAARCLKDQTLPARINTSGAVGLDANATDARDADLRRVLVLTSSQGGQNAAIILERAA
jgi:3-oxoacyl-[acyl-carrier-protein] synthase II